MVGMLDLLFLFVKGIVVWSSCACAGAGGHEFPLRFVACCRIVSHSVAGGRGVVAPEVWSCGGPAGEVVGVGRVSRMGVSPWVVVSTGWS